MMKYLLSVLSVAISTIAFAQPLEEIEHRLRLLQTRSPFRYDTTGLYRFHRVSYECDNHFKAYDVPAGKRTEDYYHVADLNDDGLKDLIYSGPCIPYDVTAIFLNTGQGLNIVFESGGEIIAIEHSYRGTLVHMLYKALGCGYSRLIQLTIDKNSTVTRHDINLPETYDVTIDELKVMNLKGPVRWSQKIDDVKGKDCSDEVTIGNHMIEIDHSSNVIQLLQSDSWRLVLYTGSETESWLGWMSM